ncbi:cytochrome c biogenesis protein [Aphanothece sacrum]|uniref:Cytochrome c biogenesis protein CcsB n=1 Tax=Aphanothece sacrum FPU1 TaxID=1920663 RepID=A0A401IG45_APHSA|nr:cytochrome c biogenesis protein [Aphanothece sacrum]GBF80184.1 cytochrome c biogenesis protein CcsB [Aphanothece sacrum FPU1]GBF85337.1 cytochrome c biogenesis protein CcsB [Aphanothece sacrum FPU3]
MTASDSSTPTDFLSLWRQAFRYLVKIISDLRLAIILLLIIALFSISGTVIEQAETLPFYQKNYPESPALFGFLTWKVILLVGLNHVYSTWWFLSLLVLLGSSLTACTFNRQFPALKAARRWAFYQQPRQFEKLALSTQLDINTLSSIAPLLEKRGYKIFQENNSLYARKGIIGKIGPIIVHASMLMILGGSIWGALTGFLAQEMIPSGAAFQVKNIIEAGPLSTAQIPTDWGIKVNRFWIDYTPNGNIDQFYSDLSVINNQGQELDRKTIYVNQPLRYKGVTFYQTDWSIYAVKVQINNSPILQIPIAPLNTNGQGKIWGTWIPTKPDLSEGVSLLAKDLQGTMIVYDNKGNLYSAIRPGMAVEINGVRLKIHELIGSTGLQIKADPGIPFVYTGFALLMAGVIMSYVSHSQIWVLQEGDRCYLGGKTNRAQVSFERELLAILDHLLKTC